MPENDDEFLASLLAMFNEEAKEHTSKLSNLLIKLENEQDNLKKKELVENSFREAHSLKGAARSVGKKNIEIICKQIEAVFSILKKDISVELSSKDFKDIHSCIDVIELLIQEQQEQKLALQTKECIKSLEPFLKNFTVKSVSEDEIKEQLEIPNEQKENDFKKEKIEVKPKSKSKNEKTKISVDKLINTISNLEEFLYLKHSFDKYLDSSHKILDIQKQMKKKFSKDKDVLKFLSYTQNILNDDIKNLKSEKQLVTNLVDKLLKESKEMLLFPFSTLLETFPKIVYDMAADLDKKVKLNYSGENINIDKRILDHLKDPFIHILRNIVDHGIETEKIRLEKNKEATGAIDIKIEPIENSKVKIEVFDDGKGFDIEQIVSSALKNNIVSKNDLESMSKQEKLNLAFASGVTTNSMVTSFSGRGLGLAIVKEKVVQLNGQISLKHVENGSLMCIVLPLSIATYQGVLLKQSGQKFILPVANIEQSVILEKERFQTVEGSMVAFVQNQMLPLYFLADLLELPREDKKSQEEVVNAFVLDVQGNKILLAVDEIDHELEVLTKSLGSQLQKIPFIFAATVLNDTSVALILNPLDILLEAKKKRVSKIVKQKDQKKKSKKSILMVDDSLTTRMLMKNILESANYDVKVAVDGLDAISFLMEKRVDLIVSDVDMPNMNGFELTKKVKTDQNFQDIPVILLTSLESKEDKEKGLDAGANAYIVKSGFDQKKLMETIEWMI